MVRAVVLSILLLVVGACDATTIPPETPPAQPLDFALATRQPIVVPPGAIEDCAGIGIDAVLRGEARDPKVAWLVTIQGQRVDVVWPAGYHARFTPLLEVRDAGGKVVLRGGSSVHGGCVTQDRGVLYLAPPFD